ncbi:MAG: baseplate J/gp47 family protein [Oscillospiraceae bacterium]|nr:baseplate J/gp47 family protein [Oscillospiraceae bacterium]
MYNNMTFEFLLERMLSRIPDDIDKREGSVIYDALAPAALELARFYSALDNVLDETFADTAGREMLIRRAAERGISPYPASPSTVRASFTPASVPVPIGSRFTLADSRGDLRFHVSEAVPNSPGQFFLICESVGEVGNISAGELVPVEYIDLLTNAQIIELTLPGNNDEDTEHLRKRYFDSLEVQSYGGNIRDYQRMTLSIPGVTGVKVEPAWAGAGTVRLVIQDYRGLTPTSAALNQVLDILDPPPFPGRGDGLSPIGHRVTVSGVRSVPTNINATFTLAAGVTFDDVRPELEQIVERYFSELRANWSSFSNIVVRAAELESRLLNESGGKVIDIVDFRFNNLVAGRNFVILANDVPMRGAVNNV